MVPRALVPHSINPLFFTHFSPTLSRLLPDLSSLENEEAKFCAVPFSAFVIALLAASAELPICGECEQLCPHLTDTTHYHRHHHPYPTVHVSSLRILYPTYILTHTHTQSAFPNNLASCFVRVTSIITTSFALYTTVIVSWNLPRVICHHHQSHGLFLVHSIAMRYISSLPPPPLPILRH